MAQSAATVTAPNPTPPTNMSCTGATPPNVPNYTKLTYLNYVGVGLGNAGGSNGAPPAPAGLWSAVVNPPPFFDDGSAASGIVFATNTAALASGTTTTSGGTENTYPGTGTASGTGTGGNFLGAVPASTSVAHEGAGTELSSTGPNNVNYTYPSGNALDTNKMVSAGPVLVKATTDAGAPVSPNSLHASSLSPATNPALTSIASIASGGGTGTCTATGTNFTRQSVLNVNGISYPTTWVSATSITCTAPKKATAGTLPVYVVTGGVVQTATVNWTFT
jgi:hypothetical protein